jgi:DNA primase catalytic subunit
MAHIYLVFAFAKDEEKAQQARHKLESWKQAFRLDKKLLYKMERVAAEPAGDDGDQIPAKAEKSAKGKTKGKAASKAATAEAPAASNEDISLLVRLGFSGHEKLSEERWVQRIPSEEPFRDASPQLVKAGEPEFEATERRFEDLD